MDSLQQAREWLRLDKNPSTRAEIEQLIAQNDLEELQRRLSLRIAFGTAGLRARMEAGFARMNSLTVIQTSQGLAHYLLENVPGAAEAGVVIGYDGRHQSRDFANLAAAAFHAKGLKPMCYGQLVHTPLVPFAVKTLRAAAGVMITASHNPKQDNGYKVYDKNGCQINTPADKIIAASILSNLEPITWDVSKVSLFPKIPSTLIVEYIAQVAQLVSSPLHETNVPRFVYTPMHGVGLRYMEDAFQLALTSNAVQFGRVIGRGLPDIMVVVESQARPDPEFSTVKYPNPEEQGALDLAKATADSKGLRLILASDPDADRFAVAEKLGDLWHQFTGDQVGVLMGYYLSQRSSNTKGQIMLTSAVSSQMLSKIAEREGFLVEECLTGFKWIGNRALQLGNEVTFGYEEALGYMVPSIVHDKDGIAAAMLFIQIFAEFGSPYALLESLYEKYGYFESLNTYWRSMDNTLVQTAFEKLLRLPTTRKVQRCRDLKRGTDTATYDQKAILPADSNANMTTLWLSGNDNDDGVRVTVRGSGTEPKIKIYLECCARTRDDARGGALEVLKAISRHCFADPGFVVEGKYDLSES